MSSCSDHVINKSSPNPPKKRDFFSHHSGKTNMIPKTNTNIACILFPEKSDLATATCSAPGPPSLFLLSLPPSRPRTSWSSPLPTTGYARFFVHLRRPHDLMSPPRGPRTGPKNTRNPRPRRTGPKKSPCRRPTLQAAEARCRACCLLCFGRRIVRAVEVIVRGGPRGRPGPLAATRRTAPVRGGGVQNQGCSMSG